MMKERKSLGSIFLNGVITAIHEHTKKLKEDYNLSVAVGVSNNFTSLKEAGKIKRA